MTRFAIAKEISREDVYLQDVNPGSYDKVCYSIYLVKEISREDVYLQDVHPGFYDKVCHSICLKRTAERGCLIIGCKSFVL